MTRQSYRRSWERDGWRYRRVIQWVVWRKMGFRPKRIAEMAGVSSVVVRDSLVMARRLGMLK